MVMVDTVYRPDGRSYGRSYAIMTANTCTVELTVGAIRTVTLLKNVSNQSAWDSAVDIAARLSAQMGRTIRVMGVGRIGHGREHMITFRKQDKMPLTTFRVISVG